MENHNIITAQSREFVPANHNCYDYYLKNTEQYGDYTAFEHQGKVHYKSEFVADVEALAAYFSKELKLKRGDAYTIFSPTNIESMIAFMALNKIGVIVNFVHPLLPAENLDDLLDLTESKGILTFDLLVEKYVPTIAKRGIPCIVCTVSTYAIDNKFESKPSESAMKAVASSIKKYDSFPDIIKRYAGQTVETVKENKDDLALYMSGGGTTGKSRTIKLSNDVLNKLVYTVAGVNTPVDEIGVDTELCCMPFFHTYGFCCGGLSAMHKGSKIILLTKFDADVFVSLMKTHKVTEFNGVPHMFKKLLAHPDFDGPHLKSIKVMYVGGDDIRPAFMKKFEAVMRKNGSAAQICQGYGLTETASSCSTNPPWINRPGTIGKPITGFRVEIWDENNKPLPTGEIGQIAITGPTLMEGYLTKDGPADEGIYKDEEGTRWILSGDLARYDEDGYLHFVGRMKRVIIISGYNVYPGDIEKLMTELTFIKECCAAQGYQDDGNAIVRLHVVLDGEYDKEECKKKITDLCTERLPAFSVPREIVFLDALPRTRLEKVDFMALTQPKPQS